MSNEIYGSSSPWASTSIINNRYLGRFSIRPIPASSSDFLYSVESQYTHRPDLLAYDLYGNHKLWWVFAQRNMDVIEDPIYDMEPGLQIYLPRGNELNKQLGL